MAEYLEKTIEFISIHSSIYLLIQIYLTLNLGRCTPTPETP